MAIVLSCAKTNTVSAATTSYNNSSYTYTYRANGTTVVKVKVWAKFSYNGSSPSVYQQDYSVETATNGYAVKVQQNTNGGNANFMVVVTAPGDVARVYCTAIATCDKNGSIAWSDNG
ncbi:hypothetical protein [Anaerosporobacter sp.]